jgi:hypothetical protein
VSAVTVTEAVPSVPTHSAEEQKWITRIGELKQAKATAERERDELISGAFHPDLGVQDE